MADPPFDEPVTPTRPGEPSAHRGPNGSAGGTPADRYHDRIREVTAERQITARRAQMVANLRVIMFGGILGMLVWVESSGTNGTPGLVGAGLFAAAFAAMVQYHGRLKAALRRLDTLLTVNGESIHRIRRRWDALNAPENPGPSPDHPYAVDLDLFGRASLAQLLGSVTSGVGRDTLTRWLSGPAPAEEIGLRQEAITDLIPRFDFRQLLEVAARSSGAARHGSLPGFLEWAGDAPQLAGRGRLVWAARVLPVASIGLLALHISGVIPYAFWLLPIVAAFAITASVRRSIHDIFRRASIGEGSFHSYALMLETIGKESWAAVKLREVRADITHGRSAAARELHRLHRLIALAELRFSSMVYPIVQGLVLWDIHVLHAMERWRERNGALVPRWLRAIGEVEMLSALAQLGHDNPTWTFAEVVEDGPPEIRGWAVGHPLLEESVRVGNDVHVGPPGTVLLVTGSNMSGKSTFLRAIGTNVVLAQAGGPVCARRFRTVPVRMYTSMHIQDSLEDGVSYFMAALRRLKLIVDAAREETGERHALLYLLDEILQGTNSAERALAVRGVLGDLLARGAIGAVTTHDLALVDSPELKQARRAVHFSESIDASVGSAEMTFDYILRPGVATSRNALRLMDLMGLPTSTTRGGASPAG